jgi:hypothetical protein
METTQAEKQCCELFRKRMECAIMLAVARIFEGNN